MLTNNVGRSNVKSFKIIKSGWHISDHLPLDIQLCVTYIIDSYALLIRTNSLNEEYSVIHNRKSITRFKDKFDINEAKKILSERADALIETCQNLYSPDQILQKTDRQTKTRYCTQYYNRSTNVTFYLNNI